MLKTLLIALFAMVLIISCKKSNDINTEKSKEVDLITTFYSNKFQINKNDIKFDNIKQEFIIQGDIIIAFKDAQSSYDKSLIGNDKVLKTDQYRSEYLVNNATIKDVKIFIDSSVPSDWITAINDINGAVSNWNSLRRLHYTDLSFSFVSDSNSADIIVSTFFENTQVIAKAYLPTSSNKPGPSLLINTAYNNLISSKKLFAMTHELGHIVGLMHTNETLGTFIPGTPQSDPNSIMNATVLDWSSFTNGDVIAISTLYPISTLPTFSYSFGPNSFSTTYQYKDKFGDVVSYYLSAGSTVGSICAVDGSVTGGRYSKGSLCN